MRRDIMGLSSKIPCPGSLSTFITSFKTRRFTQSLDLSFIQKFDRFVKDYQC